MTNKKQIGSDWYDNDNYLENGYGYKPCYTRGDVELEVCGQRIYLTILDLKKMLELFEQ